MSTIPSGYTYMIIQLVGAGGNGEISSGSNFVGGGGSGGYTFLVLYTENLYSYQILSDASSPTMPASILITLKDSSNYVFTAYGGQNSVNGNGGMGGTCTQITSDMVDSNFIYFASSITGANGGYLGVGGAAYSGSCSGSGISCSDLTQIAANSVTTNKLDVNGNVVFTSTGGGINTAPSGLGSGGAGTPFNYNGNSSLYATGTTGIVNIYYY